MSLGENKLQTAWPRLTAPPADPTPATRTVELIVVQVGGQPFGMLLKQIFSIARPEDEIFTEINPARDTRDYSEILYRGQVLRVVELAEKLKLNPVKMLPTSEILISGRLTPGGNIRESFGVSVDEIIGVWHVALDSLRLLDEWVCRKRLGKLIWGAALVDRAKFGIADPTGEVEPTSQFKDLMGETGLLASSTRPDRIGLEGIMWLESGRLALAGKQNTVEIPLMLLDLEVLRADLYRY
jgi:hypothetical protein